MIRVICSYTHGVYKILRGNIMWTTPAATEMRFGFEITMYVLNK
jgi:coenzyme PQQ precursor peptide PqqA